MKDLFRGGRLHTVCESAHCPNMGTCWKEGVATFMILGGTCTRACRFCAVPAGRPDLIDDEEPRNVALAVQQLGLRYVVVTSVARDDIEDEGALQFAKTIQAIRGLAPEVKIEVLIPDFSAKEASLKILSDAAPEVISHNIETVSRLSPRVRPQASHQRSLEVLRRLRELNKPAFIKSSLMVGLGETGEEIVDVMDELLQAGCQILTIGQYLAPTRNRRHLPVVRFLAPEEFEYYCQKGLEMGFAHVESGPLVRSSYIAEKGYKAALGIKI
jgi:lipoic acid synthetase